MDESTLPVTPRAVKPNRRNRKWTDEKIEAEILAVRGLFGTFPTVSQLREVGREDLINAISKNGGFFWWSEKLDIPRAPSDSDTGWDGERAVMVAAEANGISCERSSAVKAPFDLLFAGVLRVDVKTASYAEYGACRGWFYRIGKVPHADLLFLFQADTKEFYGLPWTNCPVSNVTISRDGGKYARYKNNWDLIHRMIRVRTNEFTDAA